MSESLPPDVYNGPHPNPHNSYGATYGEHRENLELTNGQHRELHVLQFKGIIILALPLTLPRQIFSLMS